MVSLNKVLPVGHLGRGPGCPGSAGAPICNLSPPPRNASRTRLRCRAEGPKWHRVVLYRRFAEVARGPPERATSSIWKAAPRPASGRTRAGRDHTTEIEGGRDAGCGRRGDDPSK